MHNRHTVAISDDHPHILHSLQMLFADNSRFLITSESHCGKALLASLSIQRTDIVITDFSLGAEQSTIDGFSKLRALNGRFPEVKVILLTSQRNTAILRKACDYGVRSIISKSDNVDETLMACHHVMLQSGLYLSASVEYLRVLAGKITIAARRSRRKS